MNRFYRSSAPRYTSQFVEERYPEDLMMQAGAMKYQQKQQFASDVAQFSVLNNLIQPGYRTVELASIVKDRHNKNLDSFLSRHQNDYDSPQAMMELLQMRQQWLSDPDVQLVKQDYEKGNEQYDKIRESTKTYFSDYDPNVDPKTRVVKQFRSGDRYQAYNPLVSFVDIDKAGDEAFEQVKPELRPYRDRRHIKDDRGNIIVQETEGNYEVRDESMMGGVYNTLKKQLYEGNEPWAQYALTRFRDEHGNLRMPTEEEADLLLVPMMQRNRINRPTMNTTWKEGESGSGSGDGVNNGNISFNLPISMKQRDMNVPTGQQVRHAKTQTMFGAKNPEYSYEYKVLDGRLKEKISDPEERRKAIKGFKNSNNEEENTTFKFNYLGDEAEKSMNSMFNGIMNEKGELTSNGSQVILQGQTVYDFDSGEVIQNKEDKAALAKKGRVQRFLGTVTDDNLAIQPLPGLVAFENVDEDGKSKAYGIRLPDLAEKQKPIWNMHGYMRNNVTGVGPVYAMEFIKDSRGYSVDARYFDISDPGTNGDQRSVKTDRGIYIVPVAEDGGGFTLKVFKDNPAAKDIDIFSNDSKEYVTEYNSLDYDNNEGLILSKIAEDNDKGMFSRSK